MNSEKWMDAMNMIEDEYLLETDKIRSAHKKKSYAWVKWVSMAAGLCLIVWVGGSMLRMNLFTKDTQMNDMAPSNSGLSSSMESAESADSVDNNTMDMAGGEPSDEADLDSLDCSYGVPMENNGSSTGILTVKVEITDIVENGFYGNELSEEAGDTENLHPVFVLLKEDCEVFVGDAEVSGYQEGGIVEVSYSERTKEDGKTVIYAVQVK